jgi:3-phenylpropionate/trans-cinnamate dioxygenase ferredoxin reductase subunit
MTAPTDPVVIVGGGQAGFETAFALRSKGHAAPITLIGEEDGVPYQRPPLSKAYLHPPDGGPDLDELVLRPRTWFENHDVILRCGERVVAIDRGRAEVELAGGDRLPFAHLVLATGAGNRPLPVDGADLPGVHYLRTLAEADRLIGALAGCGSVAVIGAGFIGLEVAAAARKKGLQVTVVEAADRPMSRAVSVAMSDYFTGLHRDKGVDLRLGTGVVRVVERGGRAAGVQTDTGEVLHADVVVVGIGVIPETSLAAAAGLATANGIIVDEQLRTTDPRIFAIGDCASFPTEDGRTLIRLESVQNAVDQARCVAAQLTGPPESYKAVPWFWTEQYDSKLQMAGLVQGHDVAVLRGSPEDHAFSVFCFNGERLLGVESVHRPADHMAARRLLAAGASVTPEQAADAQFDLKRYSRALAAHT